LGHLFQAAGVPEPAMQAGRQQQGEAQSACDECGSAGDCGGIDEAFGQKQQQPCDQQSAGG